MSMSERITPVIPDEEQICPISLEPIPNRYLIKLGRHSFDARELDRYVSSLPDDVDPTNPMTRETLTPTQLESITKKSLLEVSVYDIRNTSLILTRIDGIERKCNRVNYYFEKNAIVADLVAACLKHSKCFERLYLVDFCEGSDERHESYRIIVADNCELSLKEFLRMSDNTSEPAIVLSGALCEHGVNKMRRTENFFQKFATMDKYRHLVPYKFIVVPNITPTNCTLEVLVEVMKKGSTSGNPWSSSDADYAEFIEKVKNYRIDTATYRDAVKILDHCATDRGYAHVLACLIVDKWKLGSSGCEGYHCTYRHTPPEFSIPEQYKRSFYSPNNRC
jgi:hypothetical protein